MGHAEAPENNLWRDAIHRHAGPDRVLPRPKALAPAVVDQWLDDLRLSDMELRFVCKLCGRRGANISGDNPPARMGVG
jgi:hypothetical protein